MDSKSGGQLQHQKQNGYVTEDKRNIPWYIEIKWSDVLCVCKLISGFGMYW